MAYTDNVTKYRRTKDTVAIESFGVVENDNSVGNKQKESELF
jgi:hypothetical protein